MSPDQRLLHLIVEHGRELHVDDDGTWYGITPSDAAELGGPESPIGIQAKIKKTEHLDGHGPRWTYALIDISTYHR